MTITAKRIHEATAVAVGDVWRDHHLLIDKSGNSAALKVPVSDVTGSVVYNPYSIGAAGDGATNDRSILNTLANTTIPSTGGTILFDRVYLVDSDLSIPDNVTLRFENGGRLKIGSGDTITIDGAIEAGDHQIFDGAGSVKNIISSDIRAAWFGVHPANSAADNDTGIARLMRTFPAVNAITLDAYNVPSAIAGHTVHLPAGDISISASVDLTNKGGVILSGAGGADVKASATRLIWTGSAGGKMIKLDGAPGCEVRNIALLGRGVAGTGLWLDRSDAAYTRSHNTFSNLLIRDCTGNGIHISTADAVNLYQVDQIQFYNITIWACTGGVYLNNRNDLDIDFHTLRVFASSPLAGITPAYALYIKYGGCYIYGFEFGGGTGMEFSDYAIKLEDGYVQVFGGYSESTNLLQGAIAAPNATVNSSLIGFNHYPAAEASPPTNFTIDWNMEERSLNIIGGRVGNYFKEGSASGGISISDSQLHNVPNWTGRTKFSTIRNTRVLRGAAGSGTDYILNWDGLTGTTSADANRDVTWSNNLVRRDDWAVALTTGDSAMLRLKEGELQHFTHPSSVAAQAYILGYDEFIQAFTAGWETARSSYIKIYDNSISYAAAAPTAGTWKKGDVIWSTIVSAGQSPGWVCVTSGTFSAATDTTGITDIGSYVIVGVTDTSDFNIGDWVTVDKGITAHPGPFKITNKTVSTITVNAVGDSIETGVTVTAEDPVFKTMAIVAA